jgi:hypothetical protein
VAALAPKPRSRVHFAVRFAAGALRVAAFLTLLAGAAGTYGIVNLSQIPGTEGVALNGIGTIIAAGLIVGFAVVWALILWGFADALILLADLDDSQRMVQGQVADLILAARTARGPFHAEVASSTKPQESTVP